MVCRRRAVVCLQHLLLNVDPAYSAQALAEPTLAGTPFALLANSDEQIRKHAVHQPARLRDAAAAAAVATAAAAAAACSGGRGSG